MASKVNRLEDPILIIEYEDSTYYISVNEIIKIGKEYQNEVKIYLADGNEYDFYTDQPEKEYELLNELVEEIKRGYRNHAKIRIIAFDEDRDENV